MIDLEKTSGLPIVVQDDYKLKFKKPIAQIEPGVRLLKEMRPVLMDPNAQSDREEMYYMYRDVCFSDHEAMLKQYGLRYDLTVIPPAMIGQEYTKTEGHYHPTKEGTPFAFPELYEVIYGEALFLIQKMDSDFKHLVNVMSFVAKTGDKVIYPPNYGHIIVNTGKDVLVTANWVANDFKSLYKPIIDAHGMAYYVVAGENGLNFVPNANYTEHPIVREMIPKNMINFHIMHDRGPSYLAGTTNPKDLEFLTSPEKYAVELSSITS